MIPGLQGIGQIPELRKRILFTLGILAVYRFGVFVPTPGVDVEAIRAMLDQGDGSLFGLVNMFSGGALEQFSIFTLGIMPYISVSIIMQILSTIVPSLERLKKEGEAGQRVITRYTRIATIGLALFQGWVIGVGLEQQGFVHVPGLGFRITTMITLTTGTAFVMWLAEQIQERGIGNGMSMVIFSGIVARMPSVLANLFVLAREGEIDWPSIFFILFFSVCTIAGIIFVERSARKIPIQHPRRMVGKRMAQAQTQYMPLKVNMAGVMPPIFASALLVVPATIASFASSDVLREWLQFASPGTWLYSAIYIALIFFFTYFFIGITFNPNEIAENLKKNGGFIPSVRPGKPSADFLFSIMNRLAFWGGLYICVICLLPQFIYIQLNAHDFSFIFGGTAVLIVVGVVLDTVSQIESHMMTKNYEAFMNKSQKIRGGVGSMSFTRSRLLRR
jgi:preprotein translocase subunit SecY